MSKNELFKVKTECYLDISSYIDRKIELINESIETLKTYQKENFEKTGEVAYINDRIEKLQFEIETYSKMIDNLINKL